MEVGPAPGSRDSFCRMHTGGRRDDAYQLMARPVVRPAILGRAFGRVVMEVGHWGADLIAMAVTMAGHNRNGQGAV